MPAESEKLHRMRLFFFDLIYGNRIGFMIMVRQLGFTSALSLASRMQYRLITRNPFSKLNKQKEPDRQQKLSQRQMAPVIVIYDLFIESGKTKQETIDFLKVLSHEVAVEFLKFNVPVIKKEDWVHQTKSEKESVLKKIAGRFFNAVAETRLDENDDFFFDVKTCYFSFYSKELGYPQLGLIFCASDKFFFEQYQSDIAFSRTQTLAEDGKTCDFSFKWR